MVSKASLGWRTMLRKLARILPGDLIKQRTQGKATLDYIEWSTAADILDDIVPEWNAHVKSVNIVGDKVAVVVSLTINGSTRENIGFEDLNTDSYGDPFSNAYAMAFKRAAALFGVGRHLYKGPDYEPFRLATNEQLDEVLALMEQGKIPAEFHDPIRTLIDAGAFESARADAAIKEYNKPAVKRKRAPGKTKAKAEAVTPEDLPAEAEEKAA